jgi:hypothetical protein
MLPGFKHFKVYRGDTFAFRLTLGSGDDSYVISDHTFAGEIKEKGKDDVVAVFNFTIEDEQEGIVLVKLTATESKKLIASRKYVYDIEMTADDSVSTILEGPILVKGDVTL